MKQRALNVHMGQPEMYQEQTAKVYMLPEFRIVDDNYISSSAALKNSTTQGSNPFGAASDDEPIDWFRMYNNRLFNFRSHTALYQRIKTQIAKQR